jgi:hypothetical protein
MAYTPYPYQPNYFGNPSPYNYQPTQQPMMQQPQQMPQQMQAQPRPAIQQGLVLVQSEQEARSYPVAPGNSITFKDESGPYCYVKTMGFNQLDRPSFERYRLVKEDAPQEAQSGQQSGEQSGQGSGIEYALKSDVEALRDELEAVKAKLKARAAKRQREVVEDDDE